MRLSLILFVHHEIYLSSFLFLENSICFAIRDTLWRVHCGMCVYMVEETNRGKLNWKQHVHGTQINRTVEWHTCITVTDRTAWEMSGVVMNLNLFTAGAGL